MAVPPYVHIYQDVLVEFAKDRAFTGEVWRIWAYMMSKVQQETNKIPITQAEIAKGLEIKHTSQVSDIIKILVAKGIFEKVPRERKECTARPGRPGHTFRLTRKFGWRGRSEHQQELMKLQQKTSQKADMSDD